VHTMPKQCSYHSDDNGELAEEKPETRSRNHGERNVKLGASCAVEAERNSDRQDTKEQAVYSLSPAGHNIQYVVTKAQVGAYVTFTYHVKPTAMMADAPDQLWAESASLIQ
jgi:hypothetical protein